MINNEIEKQRIQNQREYRVNKSNDLIQYSKFNLTAQQQKLLLYMISLIKHTDKVFERKEIKISDFCKVAGIDSRNGKNYKDIENNFEILFDKCKYWITIFNEKEEEIRRLIYIFKEVEYNKATGTISIMFNNDLKPYLLELKENFTSYELINVLTLKSNYSIRAYELIKSRHYNELEEYTCYYSIEEFKERVGAEIYNKYCDFNARVLQPIIKEINAKTDKTLKIEPFKNERKRGKGYTHLKLTIGTKQTAERLLTAAEVTRVLDKEEDIQGQINLFDSID